MRKLSRRSSRLAQRALLEPCSHVMARLAVADDMIMQARGMVMVSAQLSTNNEVSFLVSTTSPPREHNTLAAQHRFPSYRTHLLSCFSR